MEEPPGAAALRQVVLSICWLLLLRPSGSKSEGQHSVSVIASSWLAPFKIPALAACCSGSSPR